MVAYRYSKRHFQMNVMTPWLHQYLADKFSCARQSRGRPCGVEASVQDCNIEISKLEL